MNIAEILKYCPKGTKLYSLVHGEVTLEEVKSAVKYPIKVALNDKLSTYYTKDGLFFIECGDCVLFPSKEQRDWSKFKIPVKKGDIMMKPNGTYPFISNGIINGYGGFEYICGLLCPSNHLQINDLSDISHTWTYDFCIPASEEAKKELFDKMKEAGYKWNTDTLKLEKIRRFKPFDRVLVGNQTGEKWSVNLFSHYEEDKIFPYVCLDGKYHHCVPYEGHEYLVGTTINAHQ